MVNLRSRRLETLFGVTLDQLVAEHLEALVASSTKESFDLDYKRDHYGNSESDRRKLAGDVAALVNTAGGRRPSRKWTPGRAGSMHGWKKPVTGSDTSRSW
ncbi:hypothetical protein [Actinokineospora xionganensis]|uniref:hypothetical protein n=1 Tax=Actinokineospora xionganensis TaxID=2684470 RepID=UPI001FE319C6|nr:hypothetical protein [Actinokineospora xionganensis]